MNLPPFVLFFYDSDNVSAGIKNAFHALALDEYRGPFTPKLWHLKDDLKDCSCLATRFLRR